MTELLVECHYEVLRVQPTASSEQIERSYRRLVRRCHPDTVGMVYPNGIELARDQFKKISYAYDSLIDPIRRSYYDNVCRAIPKACTFCYGVCPSDLQLHFYANDDYDETWEEFISQPYEWTEKGRRTYRIVAAISWLLMLVGVGLCCFFGYSLPLEEAYRFLATTQSSPTVTSYIPLIMGVVGVVLGLVLILSLVGYVSVKYPYSLRHNAFFKRLMFDLAVATLIALLYSGAFVGFIVGHYLF